MITTREITLRCLWGDDDCEIVEVYSKKINGRGVNYKIADMSSPVTIDNGELTIQVRGNGKVTHKVKR